MSNVINTTGRSLSNGSSTYAPNTSSISTSGGVSRTYSTPSISSGISYATNNNNNSAISIGSPPGVGNVISNRLAEDDGSMREYNNKLAQYLSDVAYSRNVSSAREAMLYNEYIMDKANEFNRESMKLQQDYNTKMANTAHQREVKDLIAAGLNPVLSAHANGASTPSLTAISSGSAHGGVSANAPMATLDTSQYATNSLFGILADLISDFLVNKNGQKKVQNLAQDMKDTAKDIIDSFRYASFDKVNIDAYEKGNYDSYDPETNTFSQIRNNKISRADAIKKYRGLK